MTADTMGARLRQWRRMDPSPAGTVWRSEFDFLLADAERMHRALVEYGKAIRAQRNAVTLEEQLFGEVAKKMREAGVAIDALALSLAAEEEA